MRLLLPLFLMLLSTTTMADTFGEVVTLLNTNCASGYGCHSGDTPAFGLDFTVDRDAIYEQLVGVAPGTAEAVNKGYELVKAGDPGRSFLYRKVNHGLHEDSNLGDDQGLSMPIAGPMQDHEIELIRQWILYGAKNDEETYISSDLLEDYYVNGNGLERIEAPAPPAPGEGFQLHLGPIFLEPNGEVEYVYRYELQNEESFEVNRINTIMNESSHHFLFFKFNEGEENSQDNGLLEVGLISSATGEASAITSNTKMISGWAYSKDIALPQGTAFTWNKDEVLKYNYHIKNYHQSAILPAELYINVYTQEAGTALHEMHSEFHLCEEPLIFTLPPGETTLEWHFDQRYLDEAGANDIIHLWSMGAHTHQYGTDFDVYYDDNGFFEQIYEGFYNPDYSFNQGFYDYSEPPFRFFDEFFDFKASDGLQVYAAYNNTSGGNITTGLTTEDEMFGMFIQYLTGDISDLADLEEEEDTISGIGDIPQKDWSIFPNPSTGNITLDLTQFNESVEVRIFNVLGETVYQQNFAANQSTPQIDLGEAASGFYLVQIKGEGTKSVQKLLIED